MPASACPPPPPPPQPASSSPQARQSRGSQRAARESGCLVVRTGVIATPSSSPRPRHRHALVIATPSSSPRPRHRHALVIAAPSFFRGDSRTRSGVRNRLRRAAAGTFHSARPPAPGTVATSRSAPHGPSNPHRRPRFARDRLRRRIRHPSRMQNGMTPARGGRDVSFCSTSGSGNGRHVLIGAAHGPSNPHRRPRFARDRLRRAHPTPVPDAEWNDPGARRQGRFILLDLRLQERSPRPDRRRTWAVESAPSAPIRPRSSSQGASDTRPGCRME